MAAAANYREGEGVGFERVSAFATTDLASTGEVERLQAKLCGASDVASLALRVTTIFRREEDGWRIVHRHADPIPAPPRGPNSA